MQGHEPSIGHVIDHGSAACGLNEFDKEPLFISVQVAIVSTASFHFQGKIVYGITLEVYQNETKTRE
jgi:hypothetical protein